MISLLYISNTFLNILAVPSNAVFCITTTLFVIRIFSTRPSDSFLTHRKGPITTGRASTILSFHNLPISPCRSWYLSILSLSFSSTLTSAGTAISMIIPFRSFFYQLKLCLIFLPLSRCRTEHQYSTTLFFLHFLHCSFWDVLIPFFRVF